MPNRQALASGASHAGIIVHDGEVPTRDHTQHAPGQTARVVDNLRTRIIEGELTAGTRLSEEALVEDLHVSRNTLREAFRLLTHDGLLVHRFHRGVFVPELGMNDLLDLYRLRLLIEPHVVRGLTDRDRHRLMPLLDAVTSAENAAIDDDWPAVITSNMRFHRSLVALGNSRRLDALIQRVLAEMRLIFAVVREPRPLYEPYVANNRKLYEGLSGGRFTAMADYLETYLTESEQALQRALTEAYGGNPPI